MKKMSIAILNYLKISFWKNGIEVHRSFTVLDFSTIFNKTNKSCYANYALKTLSKGFEAILVLTGEFLRVFH
jgi:hypothetical protein